MKLRKHADLSRSSECTICLGTASKIFTQEIASINSLLDSSIINHLAQFLQIFHIFKRC